MNKSEFNDKIEEKRKYISTNIDNSLSKSASMDCILFDDKYRTKNKGFYIQHNCIKDDIRNNLNLLRSKDMSDRNIFNQI